ncbi:hypothetical protein G9A89_006628 [Geosiphon pyriformis]|nr:hypothetical protein G9A89_006628 [Geosiphon pyriformis]
MTYLGRFNKLLRQIRQLETNDYYSDAQILDQFITGLKDKLIKKVRPYALADLATAIRHVKSYEMAMEKANHTKLVNLAIRETSSAAKKKIDQFTKKESDFQQPALFEGEVAAPKSNSSNNIIPPAQIAQNANFSDIFPFEFEANKSPFLLSNATANKQKAITAMYTKATVEGKPIRLILDSESAGSIITYQLMQQLQRTVNRPAQTVIVITDSMKKTPVGEIDNFLFTINEITIPVKVLVMDAPQYQALVGNNWLLKANANLDWETQELKISYQGQYTIVPVTCGIFNKQSEKAPVFEFKEEKEMPLTETYMALGSTSNWAEETEQKIFEESKGWKKVRYSTPEPRKQPPYILLKCKDCNKKLSSMRACISPEEKYETHMLPEEYNWIDIAMRGEVCDQTCQYALSILEKVRRGTPFDAAYNSALNKLYYYPHDAEIIFDLAMTLINRATQENVHQMKKAEYIEYTIELAGFDYEDEPHIPDSKSSNSMIRANEHSILIPLPEENDENEIEFGVFELVEKLPTTPIYLLEKQSSLQLKYFDNHGQGIRPEKAHKIDARYDLRYSKKDTLVLQPKSLTKINLKFALEIPPGAMVQIAFRSSLASKGINIREEVIDAEYTGDITIMLQNETDKPFKIEHAEKIAQAIYLPLINILGLQSVNNREQLGKSEKGTQGFGSTGQFTVPVNIALNTQNESHQILQLSQPITISFFGEHHEIYTCLKSTTTQQIFESNEQICLKHEISIPNVYIPKGIKKFQVIFYNLNNYPIVLLNKLEIEIIHSNIFQDENPQIVSNFIEIVRHTLLPNPNIILTTENYHFLEEKLS